VGVFPQQKVWWMAVDAPKMMLPGGAGRANNGSHGGLVTAMSLRTSTFG